MQVSPLFTVLSCVLFDHDIENCVVIRRAHCDYMTTGVTYQFSSYYGALEESAKNAIKLMAQLADITSALERYASPTTDK